MKQEFHFDPTIFTTGAFLQPAKIIDSTGKEIWIWYVSEFINDSFMNGKIYNPQETANSKKTLLCA